MNKQLKISIRCEINKKTHKGTSTKITNLYIYQSTLSFHWLSSVHYYQGTSFPSDWKLFIGKSFFTRCSQSAAQNELVVLVFCSWGPFSRHLSETELNWTKHLFFTTFLQQEQRKPAQWWIHYVMNLHVILCIKADNNRLELISYFKT